MPKYKYGFVGYNAAKMGKAMLYDIDASAKDLAAVCDNIKRFDTDKAIVFLEEVIELKRPVEYKRWAKKLGHRRELGGKKGRWPEKAASFVLQVIKNAVANAQQKGLSNLKIIHASAKRQSIFPRLQPKGRRTKADYTTSFVEIVVGGE